LYDIILVDVFSSLRPPFHLTTSEFVKLAKSKLTANGIVAVNIIGSFEGDEASFPSSQAATYARHFSSVSAYPVTALSSKARENILLIASDGRDNSSYAKYPEKSLEGKKYVFTDEYAPIDRIIGHVSY
jgi:spermidine synthase